MIRLVFAKKCVLPTGAANVLQSLHMAAAFRQAGAEVFFFPGVRGKDASMRLEIICSSLEDLGINPEAAEHWAPMSAHYAGIYGLRFRAALARLWAVGPEAVFYARDVKEASFFTRLPSFSKKRQLVYEIHEVLHEQPHNFDQKEALFRVEQRIFNKAAGLVAINPVLADKARVLFGYEGHILVEPSGFNADVFTPLRLFTAENPWPKTGEKVQLVYVGRFHPGKGVEKLIEAMEYLPENVHLRIIGSSPKTRFSALRQLASRIPGGLERIVFTGGVPQREVPQACVGGHIFVVPQESDALYFSPLKLQEAMALGLPVLTTPLAAFAGEREAGLVASMPGTEPREIAAGVLSLTADPEKAKQLRKNGLAASGTRTWKARAERILNFCRAIR